MARKSDHDRIARKAHELWEAAGRPHGRDQAHWDEAREIIAIEDSQKDTLLPRDTGAKTPIEEPEEALRNLADMPNLTDQGENLLTSTDREPDLVATPSGRKGRMPKVEVPTSDQPGIAPKARKAAAKSAPPKTSAKPAAAPVPAPVEVAAPPKAANAPKAASAPKAATPETVKAETPKRTGGRKKAQ